MGISYQIGRVEVNQPDCIAIHDGRIRLVFSLISYQLSAGGEERVENWLILLLSFFLKLPDKRHNLLILESIVIDANLLGIWM
jgi:hypothetical protein